MRNISITLYSLNELSESMQNKAIGALQYLQVEDSFWFEPVYDHFHQLCAGLGIRILEGSLTFSGFYGPQDGSAFSAAVDLNHFFSAVRSAGWKQYAPENELDLNLAGLNARILHLIENGSLTGRAAILARTQSAGVRVETYWGDLQTLQRPFANLQEGLLQTGLWLEKVAEKLNSFLFESLSGHYEYLTRESSVRDYILANDFYFTRDGRPCFDLECLAEKDP